MAESKKKRDAEDSFPSLSRKEAVVLELLLDHSAEEMYGLQLVKESPDRLKRGTIYVTLDRMEKKGYVNSRHEEKPDTMPGMPRRLYQITGYGSKIYEAWQLAVQARRNWLRVAEGVS